MQYTIVLTNKHTNVLRVLTVFSSLNITSEHLLFVLRNDENVGNIDHFDTIKLHSVKKNNQGRVYNIYDTKGHQSYSCYIVTTPNSVNNMLEYFDICKNLNISNFRLLKGEKYITLDFIKASNSAITDKEFKGLLLSKKVALSANKCGTIILELNPEVVDYIIDNIY